MAETTKVFTGKLTFTTNLSEISGQIEKFAKAANDLPKIINGKVQPIDPRTLSSLKQLGDTADNTGKKVKSALATLPATMDNIAKAGGASTNTLKNQMDGLYLATTKNGNAAQGLREIFYGTATSTNFFAQQLDKLSNKSIGFGTTQTKLQGQMERLASTADMSARAMALSGKSFQATVYESLGPGSAQMVQPFLQQINRARIAMDSVGKAASMGKDTANSLRQAQMAVKGLENEYKLLKAAGIIPVGSASDVAFQKMITQAKNAQSQVQGMSARYEQVRTSVNGTKKSTDELAASAQKSNTIFGSLSISLKNMFNIFKTSKSSIDNTTSSINNIKPALDSVNSKVEQTGNIFKSVFGGAFLGSLLGNLSAQLTNIFSGVTKQFYDLNNLVQNTNITIEGMLTGSTVNAKEAIAGFTAFVKDEVARTPFEFKDAIDASLRLVQQGFDPQKWLRPAANAAAAMNKPMEQFIGGITKLMNGARGAGVDMMRDFGLNVNNISGMIDDGTGKLVKMNWQFDKQGSLVNETGEAMAILNAYLSQNATFANAASSRSKSLSGVVSNLKDNFSSMLLAIGQPIFDKLTLGATSLLTTFNNMMPTLNAIATGIGQSLGTAINFASNLIFNFKGTVDGLIPSLGDIGYVVQAMVSGDWTTAWNGAQIILSDALAAAGSILLDFASNAASWGYSFIDQIASGIIDAANGALQDAMNYVGDTIAGFLEPGSPPKYGPLSTIDRWGAGVMDVFNEGMASASNMPFVDGVLKAMLELQTAQNKVAAGNKKVAGIQKEIAKSEKAGYIPQELKDKLAIAQDGVKLAQEEVDFRKIQLQQQQELSKQGEQQRGIGGGKQAQKSNNDMANASEKAAKVVKQTWQEAYADNLKQLEDKRKLGVINEEEYAKELLKIETDFVDNSVKDGIISGLDDHVKKIGELKKQIEGFKPEKAAKGAGLFGDFKPASVEEIFGNFAKTVPKKLADVATEAGDKFVANIQVKFKSAFSTKAIGNMVSGLFDNLKKYLTPDKLPFIAGGAGLVGLIIGPKIGVAIASLGTLAGTIGALAVAALPWVAAATAITLIIMNWDKILPVVEPIWKAIVEQVTNFVNASGGIAKIKANLELLWNSITTMGKRAWDVIKGITTDLVNFDFAGAIAKLGSIGSVFDFSGMSIPWSNLVTALTTGWNTYITPIFTGWKDKAITWVVGAWANAPTAITWLLNQISTFFENSWPTIYAALATWIPKVWGWVQQAALGAGVALNALLLTFSAWAASGEGQAAIIRFGDNLGKFIVDAISLIFKSSDGASSVIGTLLASLGAAALQLAFIAANVGVRLVQGVIDGMMTKIGGVNWKETIAAPIIKALIMAFTPLGLITALQETFGKVIAAIKSYLGIASPSTVFAQIGVDLIMGLVGGITSIIPTLLSNATDIAGKLIASIKTSLGLDGGIGGLASSLFGGATTAPAANMQVAPTDMTQSSAAVAAFASQAGPIIMNIQNLFIGLKNIILDTFSAFSINFVGGFLALSSTLDDNVSSIKMLVSTRFNEMSVDVLANIRRMNQNAGNEVKTYPWPEIGKNIVEGIAKGIDDNKQLVVGRLVDLAKEAVKAMKDELGIKSPSVKFFELGVQSMEGFQNGITQSVDTTGETVRDSMEKVLKTSAVQIFGPGAKKQVKNFFHFFGTPMSEGMQKLNAANNLTLDSLKQLAEQTTGMPIPKQQMELLSKYGQQIIDQFKATEKAAKTAFGMENLQKGVDLLAKSDEIMQKFNAHVTELEVSAATTMNELIQIADADIDNDKLNAMMAALNNGATFGADMDAAITDAWLAQDKLNGALDEQTKMQKDLLKIEQARQKIDLMNQQLELAKMIKDNNLNGKEVMQGLQLGAEASVADVTAAIARALEQMVGNAQKALGISSPSAVFKGIGLNIGAGLNAGLLASLANVKSSMGNLGSSTLDALAAGLNTGGAGLNASGLDKLGGNMGLNQTNQFNTTINDKIDLQFFKRFILDTVSQGVK